MEKKKKRAKKKYEPCRLIDDECFNQVVSHDISSIKDICTPFLQEDDWQKAKPAHQKEYSISKKYTCKPDGTLMLMSKLTLLEMQNYRSLRMNIKYFRKHMSIAYLGAPPDGVPLEEINTLVFTCNKRISQGKPYQVFETNGYFGNSWPRLKITIIDVTLPQATEARQIICNDLMATSLQELRTPSIINAYKLATGGNESMKRIQSRIGKAYYKDGITDTKRKTALRMVQQYGFSITDAAAINEIDEGELRAWLKRKGLAVQPV